jgi:DNA-binding NtrC family response regulator
MNRAMPKPSTPARSEIQGRARILIADDEPGVRESLAEVFREEGYEVLQAADGSEAIALIEKHDLDVVISDLKMPGADGLEVLQRAREVSPQVLVLIMTAHATVDSAVAALRRGAHDYFLKPVIFDDALHKVESLLRYRHTAWENQFLRTEANRHWIFDNVVSRSAAMQKVMERVARVGPTPTTVLITGDSGVGKEVVARAVHHSSDRRDRVMLAVNCGAIPDTLLESQLFGHVRGSFTGAVTNQEGLFHHARNGTMFLDEIGEMPLGLQVKLLRAIETKEVHSIGAAAPSLVDVRIIAATNRDLAAEVQAGRFREDLYYRLNVFEINVPPLSERREDIPPLIDHFVHIHNVEMNRHYKGVDNPTLKALMSMPWKGNVRQLDNVLEHAMILGDGEWIHLEDLPVGLAVEADVAAPAGDNLRDSIRSYEKAHIENVLVRSNNDKKEAAKRLGIALSSLYRKLEELGIQEA